MKPRAEGEATRWTEEERMGVVKPSACMAAMARTMEKEIFMVATAMCFSLYSARSL